MAAANVCMPFRPAFENSVAVPGAQAVLTLSGTTTLVSVYSDSGLSVAATNPIVASAAGHFPQRWVNDNVALRMRVFAEDADITLATPLEDFDPYTPQESGAAAQDPVFTVATGEAGTSVTISGTYPNKLLTIPRGAAGASGALSDGDMGDVVVSGTGTVLTVDAGVITLAKQANLAEDRIIGRQSAGAGVPEALTIGVAAAIDIPDRAAGDTRWIQRTESLVHELWIPASALLARTTNGAAIGSSESATNKVMRSTLDFDKDTIEYAQADLGMLKSWDEGTITVKFAWEAPGGTGDVVWGAQALALSNDDVIDTAFGTAGEVTDSVTATSDVMHTSYTAAITPSNTPAANDQLFLQVYRKASSGSDTLAFDAKLLGIWVKLTTNAADDS